jgi:hypothetical protein
MWWAVLARPTIGSNWDRFPALSAHCVITGEGLQVHGSCRLQIWRLPMLQNMELTQSKQHTMVLQACVAHSNGNALKPAPSSMLERGLNVASHEDSNWTGCGR